MQAPDDSRGGARIVAALGASSLGVLLLQLCPALPSSPLGIVAACVVGACAVAACAVASRIVTLRVAGSSVAVEAAAARRTASTAVGAIATAFVLASIAGAGFGYAAWRAQLRLADE